MVPYATIESSIVLGEALLKARQPAAAQPELERAIAQGEKLGTRGLLVRSHYLMGLALRQGGNESDAVRHITEARTLLDAIQKEAGTNDLSTRADLASLVAETATPSTAARR